MSWSLTVTDLKQFEYCPRVFFYERCLPDVRPRTAKMDEGILAGEAEAEREKRRQLRVYGFAEGTRHFDVSLYSSTLGITALIDMVILRPDGQELAIPVDYKLSDIAGRHFQWQLACYALLLEEEMGLPAPYGFLYFIPLHKAERIALSRIKPRVRERLALMRTIVEQETMPQPAPQRNRCLNCEFRRFCNDVV